MRFWYALAAFSQVSIPARAQPTFSEDILPLLEHRCQVCHRPGEIGPMPLVTYRQVRPWAKAIRQAALAKTMPPWFADPGIGAFANDPSLTQDQIRTIVAWVDGGAPEGPSTKRPASRNWPEAWNIGKPDAVLSMPVPFEIAREGEIPYQYITVPTGFNTDRWIQKVELRPGNRAAVHHAVVYIREPGSNWVPGTFTTSDILFTYTPGNSRDEWPTGMAKLIEAGSELVFEMHYTATKACCADRTSVGVVYSKTVPAERVLTLQLNNDRFVIPPGHPDYHVHVAGTLPNDAKLLSLYPHMHGRGKSFQYSVGTRDGMRPLLKVNHYDFYWQLTYRLSEPLLLKKGTTLACTATFDNSRNNPRNPDPDLAVHFGYQSSDEMMIGFFDLAVPAGMDKESFFIR